jgi:hypothetical protein
MEFRLMRVAWEIFLKLDTGAVYKHRSDTPEKQGKNTKIANGTSQRAAGTIGEDTWRVLTVTEPFPQNDQTRTISA